MQGNKRFSWNGSMFVDDDCESSMAGRPVDIYRGYEHQPEDDSSMRTAASPKDTVDRWRLFKRVMFWSMLIGIAFHAVAIYTGDINLMWRAMGVSGLVVLVVLSFASYALYQVRRINRRKAIKEDRRKVS